MEKHMGGFERLIEKSELMREYIRMNQTGENVNSLSFAQYKEGTMRRFVDEDGDSVTMEEIKARFEELKASGELDADAKLAVYIRDVTGKDGFLTEI